MDDAERLIRDRLRALEKTQVWLAGQAGVAASYMSELIRGERKDRGPRQRPRAVAYEVVVRMAAALEIDADELNRLLSNRTGHKEQAAASTGPGLVKSPTYNGQRSPDDGDILPTVRVPVLESYIPAGGTLPADAGSVRLPVPIDQAAIDSGRYVAIKVSGDCMAPAGIEPGSYVIVDREASPRLNKVCVLYVDGSWTLKRLTAIVDGLYVFSADDHRYEPITVKSEDARIQGVAIHAVRVIDL